MKVSGFWALFLVVVTALAFFNFLSPSAGSWFPDLVAANYGHRTTMIVGNRKLKEDDINSTSNNKGDSGHMTLEDYNPPDPVPSSKAYIKPAPIEHGTPLMPFIPKPSPPDVPSPGDYK